VGSTRGWDSPSSAGQSSGAGLSGKGEVREGSSFPTTGATNFLVSRVEPTVKLKLPE